MTQPAHLGENSTGTHRAVLASTNRVRRRKSSYSTGTSIGITRVRKIVRPRVYVLGYADTDYWFRFSD